MNCSEAGAAGRCTGGGGPDGTGSAGGRTGTAGTCGGGAAAWGGRWEAAAPYLVTSLLVLPQGVMQSPTVCVSSDRVKGAKCNGVERQGYTQY